jgi:hypothetical protein
LRFGPFSNSSLGMERSKIGAGWLRGELDSVAHCAKNYGIA